MVSIMLKTENELFDALNNIKKALINNGFVVIEINDNVTVFEEEFEEVTVTLTLHKYCLEVSVKWIKFDDQLGFHTDLINSVLLHESSDEGPSNSDGLGIEGAFRQIMNDFMYKKTLLQALMEGNNVCIATQPKVKSFDIINGRFPF